MAEEKKKYPRMVYPNGPGSLDNSTEKNSGVLVKNAEEEASVMGKPANGVNKQSGASWQ